MDDKFVGYYYWVILKRYWKSSLLVFLIIVITAYLINFRHNPSKYEASCILSCPVEQDAGRLQDLIYMATSKTMDNMLRKSMTDKVMDETEISIKQLPAQEGQSPSLILTLQVKHKDKETSLRVLKKWVKKYMLIYYIFSKNNLIIVKKPYVEMVTEESNNNSLLLILGVGLLSGITNGFFRHHWKISKKEYFEKLTKGELSE